jgi:zinc protease
MISHFRMISRAYARAFAVTLLSGVFLSFGSFKSAEAMKIQEVVSQKGVKAWLVEDHTLPLLSMQFGFRGGSSQDPKGKEGLAYFVSGMMDEGAGQIKSQEFQEKLQDLAISMSFDANRDVMTGGVRTLTRNRDEAFQLLRLALTEARFDEDAFARVREQILSIIKMDSEDPDNVAADAWHSHVFNTHPYGTRTKGTAETIGAVTPADLKGFVKRNYARDNLQVAVVGAINAKELAAALDVVFGDLPAKAELAKIDEATWRTEPRQLVVPMDTPQTVVNFGLPGPKRKDEDFIPAYVLNYIIGGGGFASKLMEEVREKRGLAYSVYTSLSPLDHAGINYGGVATENKRVAESIKVIKQVFADVAKNGPTAEELENAKRYLTGSYALRFSSSSKIAQILLWIQIEELGIDYIDKRNSLIEAVTLADLKRVAKSFNPDAMVMTIVGQPDGLETTGEIQPKVAN